MNSINRKHISKSRFYCTLNKEEKLSYSRLRRKTRHASVFQVVILMQVLHLKFIHNINAWNNGNETKWRKMFLNCQLRHTVFGTQALRFRAGCRAYSGRSLGNKKLAAIFLKSSEPHDGQLYISIKQLLISHYGQKTSSLSTNFKSHKRALGCRCWLVSLHLKHAGVCLQACWL